MVHEDPVYRLTDMSERLKAAEKVGDTGLLKNDVRYFESAFTILKNSWADFMKANRRLEDEYSMNLTGEELEPAEIDYAVDLERIDESSHPASVGLALPRYFEMLRETEDYLLEKFEELDAETRPSQYPSSEVLPKES